MKIEKLLFVTEFEELKYDALQSLMDLKSVGLNHVVFLHVINRDDVAMQRGIGYFKAEEIKQKEIANVYLIDWAESLFEKGMEVGAHIVVGFMIPKMISTAQDEDVDLIVTSYHKKSKFKEIFEGVDMMEVIRGTGKPVLVHKYMTDSGKVNNNLFQRPLMPIDFEHPIDNAMDMLKGLSKIINEIVLVHIIPDKKIKGDSSMEIQKVRQDKKEKLDELCDKINSLGIKAESHLYVGSVDDELERIAQERNASMIILETSKKESIKEKLFGNVAKNLAEHSEFPILLIPANG